MERRIFYLLLSNILLFLSGGSGLGVHAWVTHQEDTHLRLQILELRQEVEDMKNELKDCQEQLRRDMGNR